MFERYKKMIPTTKLQKPWNLVVLFGEVLGDIKGTVFEKDSAGRNQYDNPSGYFETKESNLIVVGAAYLILVYEGIIASRNRQDFEMEVKELL